MSLDNYKNQFSRLLERQDFEPQNLIQLRTHSFQQFLETGFPTQKWENWRFTNLKKLGKETFRIAGSEDLPEKLPDLKSCEIPSVDTLVIINGHYQPELSSHPLCVTVETLLEFYQSNPQRFSENDSNPFHALNTAFMDSGLAVTIRKNSVLEQPLRFLFLFTSLRENIMISPQIHVVAEENSSGEIIEHITGNIHQSSFLNLVGCLTLCPNSFLDYTRIITGQSVPNQFADFHVEQERDTRFRFFQYAEARPLCRLDMDCELKGEGSECDVYGLTLSDEANHSDNNIKVNHIAPNCQSNQSFKSILRDDSSGVFNGRTIVCKGAQKTDARQSNKNLLLSKKAVMNSNPQLEIKADDVKCAHASTTGALDEEALFYLRSRGLDIQSSKALMVRGFALEELELVKNKNTFDYLMKLFQSWL